MCLENLLIPKKQTIKDYFLSSTYVKFTTIYVIIFDEALHYSFDLSNQSFSLHSNLYFYSTRSLLTDQIDLKNIPFKVSFENPAQQVTVQIEGDNQIGVLQAELYDLSGKLLDQKQSSVNQTVQLGNDRLESGVYIISIIENSKRYNWKVIIQ